MNAVKCQWPDMVPERAYCCKHAVIKVIRGEPIVLCDCPGRARLGKNCFRCGGI